MSSLADLTFHAGREALARIRDGGFSPERIAAYFGPAGGPRWLVAGGFDLSLLESGILGRSRPVLLAGSSAGAWRFAAWIQPEPEKSYRALRDAYIDATYTRKDTPRTVLASLRRIVDAYVEDDALSFALAHRRYRLAVFTARARHLVAGESRLVQKTGLLLAFAGNAIDRTHLIRFVERVVFYSGAKPPAFCLHGGFAGRAIPLTEQNFKHAILASGAIPLVVAGVRDIFGAPRGIYRDGGLTDYHLAQRLVPGDGDVALFFHHQERNVPGWLDKRLRGRRVPPEILDPVLMVRPSDAFISSLPRGRIPDRDDFLLFLDDPEERKRIWREVVRRSAHLGEVFLDALAGGRIRDVVLPLTP